MNEIKLNNYLDINEFIPVADDEFPHYFNSVAGFIGPAGLQEIKIIADNRVKHIRNGVIGANEEDFHYINANPDRDFTVDDYLNLRMVKEGDPCPKCEGKLEIKSGIEVGHIFKLGTKYSESLGATYLDENGKEQTIVMGSYGIGITRLVAAAIEQNHDENGICWPLPIAPYQVIILPLGRSDKVANKSETLYNELKNKGIEVLLDDRQERAGVKFNDADLIGIPLRITIGSRSLKRGVVEVKIRKTGEEREIEFSDAINEINNLLNYIRR